jgi:Xaa-Pro aminopeptidase
MGAGANAPEMTKLWAAEIADLARAHGGGNTRLACDHLDVFSGLALQAEGIELVEGQALVETARLVKTADEITAMRAAVAAAEAGMWKMREVLQPGITENELWSHLHRENIARGGQWIETRLLASGPRTNPWFHESSDRVIEDGDLVSFDTDLVGPYMMCADISRAYVCGDEPSAEQQRLYAIAVEQIEHNLGLLKPGVSILEWADRGYQLPEICLPNRYSVVFHGVGMCDEYPCCYYREDAAHAYDIVIEPGMCLCFESYVGEVGGEEGVKLERQVLVTETGYELLDSFPFEDGLLPSRWV